MEVRATARPTCKSEEDIQKIDIRFWYISLDCRSNRSDTEIPSPRVVPTVPDVFDATAPARYIKLGRGSKWAQTSLERGEIHLGHSLVPHELAASGDRAAIETHLIGLGRSPGKARDFAREIMDFYFLESDTTWITFHKEQLWWARATPDVHWIGETETTGARMRRTIEPWRNTDAKGTVLEQCSLGTRLTKVAAYRQTLCGVESVEYLMRRLAGEEEPIVREALGVRSTMVASAGKLIAALHWADFETLVDLLLSRSGWHRVSALGGTMKDADLVVEQTVTGETALVQVKSRASQAVLDDYVERFDANPGWSRLIFVCHSPASSFSPPDRPDVLTWTRNGLAEATIRNGLFDWLISRAQ